MKRFSLLALTIITAILAALGRHNALAEEKVRFSVAAVTGSYMDEFIAIENGYHREEGLSVEMIRFLGKYTQRKREFNEVDYDSTLPVLTSEGWVSDDILKEDVAVRAELVGVGAPADYGKFFDYALVKKIYRELKAAGWKPTP